jgi:hypothetical protein
MTKERQSSSEDRDEARALAVVLGAAIPLGLTLGALLLTVV